MKDKELGKVRKEKILRLAPHSTPTLFYGGSILYQ